MNMFVGMTVVVSVTRYIKICMDCMLRRLSYVYSINTVPFSIVDLCECECRWGANSLNRDL